MSIKQFELIGEVINQAMENMNKVLPKFPQAISNEVLPLESNVVLDSSITSIGTLEVLRREGMTLFELNLPNTSSEFDKAQILVTSDNYIHIGVYEQANRYNEANAFLNLKTEQSQFRVGTDEEAEVLIYILEFLSDYETQLDLFETVFESSN